MKRCIVPLLAVWVFLGMAGITTAHAQDSAAPANLDEAFKNVATYEFGQSRESLSVVYDAIRDSQSSPDARKDLIARLIAVVESPAATLAGKDFACRNLSAVAGEEVIPAVAKLLGAADTANMARYVLERVPGKAACDALLAALPKAEPAVQVGIINSLGVRKCAAATAPLAKLAAGSDSPVAAAAMVSLAKIATPEAVKALAGLKSAPDALKAVWADAYLLAADKLLAAGNKDQAAAIYAEMDAAGQPDRVRVAAFRGRVMSAGDAGVPLVVEALTSGNAQLQAAATGFVRCPKMTGATEAFAAVLPKLDAAGQALLLAALGDRGDGAALPGVAALAKSEDAAVRAAAYAAMGKVGNASCVPALAQVAAGSAKDEAAAARTALESLRGDDVDGAIVAELTKVEPPVRAELAKSLAARSANSAVPALIESAKDADEKVREESFKALGALAAPADLPVLVDMLVKVEGAGARREAEKAVVSVAKNIADAGQRSAALLAVLPSVKDPVARGSFYTVMAQNGDPNGLEPVRTAAAKAKDQEMDAAVRALAAWPDPIAVDDLMKLTAASKNDVHRSLMMRGMLKLLEMPSDRAKEKTTAYYTAAMEVAKSVDEKKMVLSALPNAKDLGVLGLAAGCVDNPDLQQEAKLAVQKIKVGFYKATASNNDGEAGRAIDGNLDNRWHAGANQAAGQWFQIDQGGEYEVLEVILDNSNSQNDFPRAYEVFVGNDPASFGEPVAKGEGSKGITSIKCTPKKGRFVRIVQTGASDSVWWSINEVRIDSK